MIEKVNAAKISRAQADSLHQAYVKTKEDILQIHVKIAELTGQITRFENCYERGRKSQANGSSASYKERQNGYKEREKLHKEQQQVVKEKQQAIKEKLGAEAKEKLQKGEKLSWNEFQLVMGDDEEDESETQD